MAWLPVSQLPAAEILMPRGGTWKYFDQGSEPAGWKTVAFNDQSWQEGPAPLGFGDGDESTLVGFGPNSSDRYITTYFRKSIVVPASVSEAPLVTLRLQRDDGAVVYLDGTEIARSNMPTGPVQFLTRASITVAGSEEDEYFPLPVTPALFTEGSHLLAVEIHQAAPNSSDLSFDLEIDYGSAHPGEIDYVPNFIEMDGDGLVYLVDAPRGQINRWSVPLRQFLETVTINPGATVFTYSPKDDSLYIGYADGAVRVIRLDVPSPSAEDFANIGTAPDAIIDTGDALLVTSGTTYRYFSDTGTLLATATGSSFVNGIWDPVGSRLLFFPKTSTTALRSRVVRPDFSFEPEQFLLSEAAPLRASADGSGIVTGSGRILAPTIPFSTAGSLAETARDMAWSGIDTLFTLRQGANSTVSELRKWTGATWAETARLPVAGAPLRVFSYAGAPVVVTTQVGKPRVHVFDANLDEVAISEALPGLARSPAVTARSHTSLTLRWDAVPDAENYLVQYRVEGVVPWTEAPLVPMETLETTIPGLLPLTSYELRFQGVNAVGGGNFSSIRTTETLATAQTPMGHTYGLDIIRVTHNEIEMVWADNASNETGFRLYRSLAPFRPAAPFQTLPANTTRFIDTGLPPSTLYYYWVEAFNGALAGEISEPDSATTATSASPPLSGFTSISAVYEEPLGVRVSWTDRWLNEDGFILLRRERFGSGSYEEIARTGINERLFYDTTTSPAVAYEYLVTVFNTEGSYPFSSPGTITVPSLGGTYLYDEAKVGGVQYFAFKNPNRLERFNLQTGQWLSPIPTPDEVTGLAAGIDTLYVAEGRKISRLAANGTLLHLVNRLTAATSGELFEIAGHLIVKSIRDYSSYDRITGALFEVFSTPENVLSLRAVPGALNAYARAGSNTLVVLRFRADGGFNYVQYFTQSTTLRDFTPRPDGTALISPLDAVVRVSEGDEILGSLGTQFLDIDFAADGKLALIRDQELFVYDADFKPRGFQYFPQTISLVATEGTTATVFGVDSTDPHGMTAATVSLAGITLPVLNPPLESSALSNVGDSARAFVDTNGLVYLYASGLRSIFRWSPGERRYLASIPLVGSPVTVSYMADGHRLFIVYDSGIVTRIDLATGFTETLLFATRGARLTALDAYLHIGGRIYDTDGTITDQPVNVALTYPVVWIPSARRLMGASGSWFDLSPAGVVTGSGEPSLASNFPPVANSDGSAILFGDRSIQHPVTFAPQGAISLPYLVGAWAGNSIYTMRNTSSATTQIHRWDAASGYKLGRFAPAEGTPLGLFDVPEGILLVSLVSKAPVFTLYDRSSLARVFASEGRAPTPDFPLLLARDATSLAFELRDALALEAVIEFQRGSSGPWMLGATIPAGMTGGIVTGLEPGVTYNVRLRIFGAAYDATSPESAITTPLPTAAAGEPYNLRVVAATTSTISLHWNDSTTKETGFRLLSSTDNDALTGTYTLLQSLPAGTTDYTLTGLDPATTRHFRVQAFNAAGLGDRSSPRTGATLSEPDIRPRAPTGYGIGPRDETAFRLSWFDKSGNEDGFIIRMLNASGPPTEIGRVGPNKTSFLIENLPVGFRLRFEVAAYNDFGEARFETQAITFGLASNIFTGYTAEGNGIFYAAMRAPDRIERYHLNSRQWLESWPLPSTANAIATLGSDVYVEAERLILHIAGNGTVTHLGKTNTSSGELHALGSALLYRSQNGSIFYRMDRATGADLGTFDPTTNATIRPLALSGDRQHLYGALTSGNTLIHLTVSPSGQLLNQSYPPVEASISRSAACHLMNGGTRIAFETGSVFSLPDFSYQGHLTPFTDLAFTGPVPLLLSQREVIASRPSPFAETGVASLPTTGDALVVSGSDVIGFFDSSSSNRGFAEAIIPLAALLPRPPVEPEPVENTNISYSYSFLDESGILWFFAINEAQLFRWNVQTRAWIDPIPLPPSRPRIGHWPSQGKVAVIDDRGAIRTIPIGAGAPVPATPFANAQSNSLVAMGDRLGALGTLNSSFDASGNLLDFDSATGDRHLWDGTRQRLLYLATNNTIAALPVDAAGRFGTPVTAPVTTVGSGTPLRLRPDGQALVLVDTGQILDPGTFQTITSLNRRFLDVTWMGNAMFSIEQPPEKQTRAIAHGPSGQVVADLYLPGVPQRIFARGNELIVLTSRLGDPRIFVLSPELTLLADSAPFDIPSITIQPLHRVAEIGGSVTLEVRAVGAFPLGYQWYHGSTPINGETGPALTLSGLNVTDGGAYTVRVSNANGYVDSLPADLTVGTRLEKFAEAGNLLIRRTLKISEIAGDGSIRQSFVPSGSAIGSLTGVGDIAVDRFGRLHTSTVLNTTSATLATYHGEAASWMYFSDGNSQLTSNVDRDLAIIGDGIVTRASRFGLLDWANSPVTTDVPGGVSEISIGLDGNVYALGLTTPRTQVFVLDPATFMTIATIPISGTAPQAVAGAADGSIFLGRANGMIDRLAPNGATLATLATGILSLTDIGISGDGRVAAGSLPGTVILTRLDLTSFELIEAPGTGASYTAWVPSPTLLSGDPTPVFDPVSGLFRQEITIRNTSNLPLETLEIRIAGLPNGVRLYNGSGSNHLLFGATLLPGESTQVTIEYLAAGGAIQSPFTPVVQVLPNTTPDSPPSGVFDIRNLALSSNGRVEITFPTEASIRYQIEHSNTGATWSPVGPPLRAVGSTTYWIDSLTAASQMPPVLLRVRRLSD